MGQMLTVHFAWAIGDLVIPTALVEESRTRWKLGDFALLAIGRVFQRRIEQCVGGTQMFYMIETIGRHSLHSEDGLMAASDYFEEYV